MHYECSMSACVLNSCVCCNEGGEGRSFFLYELAQLLVMFYYMAV